MFIYSEFDFIFLLIILSAMFIGVTIIIQSKYFHNKVFMTYNHNKKKETDMFIAIHNNIKNIRNNNTIL